MIKPILFFTCIVFLSSCGSNNTSTSTEKATFRADYSAPKKETTASTDSLFRFEDEKGLIGYKDKTGKVKIPASFKMSFSDVFLNYGFVMDQKNELVGVNRKGKFLYNAYIYDSGPDYIECNRFRIKKDERVGFANGETGQIVILPELSYAEPFHEDLAVFAIGGESKLEGEHTYWSGGKWGVIDTNGKVIVEPVYTSIESYENGKAAAVLDGKKIKLDKTGKQI